MISKHPDGLRHKPVSQVSSGEGVADCARLRRQSLARGLCGASSRHQRNSHQRQNAEIFSVSPELACLWCRERCNSAQYAATSDEPLGESLEMKTRWRGETNSNQQATYSAVCKPPRIVELATITGELV
jgi:hypothetical protein